MSEKAEIHERDWFAERDEYEFWIDEQARRRAESINRNRPDPRWIDASKWLPLDPHEVLATDSEGKYLAYYKEDEWWDAVFDEPVDSVITHWMELPELPED
jgi:hypothetical protein